MLEQELKRLKEKNIPPRFSYEEQRLSKENYSNEESGGRLCVEPLRGQELRSRQMEEFQTKVPLYSAPKRTKLSDASYAIPNTSQSTLHQQCPITSTTLHCQSPDTSTTLHPQCPNAFKVPSFHQKRPDASTTLHPQRPNAVNVPTFHQQRPDASTTLYSQRLTSTPYSRRDKQRVVVEEIGDSDVMQEEVITLDDLEETVVFQPEPNHNTSTSTIYFDENECP